MKKNNVIDESKKELLREVLNYSDEYLFEELTPRTLKKMHNFLVEHKCAETFKEIKSKNQINIKGCAPNGLERLIGKEIREQYGLDILEASEKFTTFYPIFSEGVIKYESVNGLHYTHFKVSKDAMMVLRKNTIDSVINGIVRKANITKLYAATGFVFSSGLRLLQESLNIINDRNGKCRIVAGSLNSCANENVNNKIDKTTVNYLNALIRDKKIELYSYIGAFYHGKFYYLCNEDYAYIIIGSSNISKAAFRSNFELDILHKVKLGSSQDKLFSNWFNGFISQCDKITNLDEKQFEDFNWNNELDVFKPLNRKIVSSNEIKKRIAALTDEETQFRLNIWMDYRPDIICDDISIEALKSYTMFAFLEEELVVFESFEPQNAFYVFGCPNGLENLINSIAKLTKSQMTLSKWYVDRGNHISNRKSLQQRISRLFKH